MNILKENIENRLTLNEEETIMFQKLQNNYKIKDTVFISKGKKYVLHINYDNKSVGHLFKNINDSLLYTFKVGNKVLYKTNSKIRMVNYIVETYKTLSK